MLDRLLPRRIDNDHRGHGLAPWLFALVVLVQILHFLPIVRTGAPPGSVVNLVLLAVMIVGLALSLRSPGNNRAQG